MNKASVSAFTQYSIKKRTQKMNSFPFLISTFEYIVYLFYLGDYHKLSTCSNNQVRHYRLLENTTVDLNIMYYCKCRLIRF